MEKQMGANKKQKTTKRKKRKKEEQPRSLFFLLLGTFGTLKKPSQKRRSQKPEASNDGPLTWPAVGFRTSGAPNEC